eukprot:scaffold8450_cov215-Amphora_coffeaeformis.AAC.12
MIGVGPETGGKIVSADLDADESRNSCIDKKELPLSRFDPVGLAQWAPADFLRKAELSNGRSAMLANVGWFFPKVAGTFASDDVTTTDPLEAIFQADPQWWAQFLLICGVIESIKYRGELEGKSYTGEGPAVVDYANMWDTLDAKGKEDMRMKELKNGRLAMIGFASYVAAELIPGSVPALSF